MKGRPTPVGERLGFEPSEFYAEVTAEINEHVEASVNGLKKELTTIAKSKGLKVTPATLDQCCHKLQERMKATYGRNMHKFGMYADRNIFVLPTPAAAAASGSSSSSSGGGGGGGGGRSSSGNGGDDKTELQHLSEEAERLREKYVSLRQKHATLLTDCANGEAMLKDMRATLFDLRLSMQADDMAQLMPFPESIATMAHNKQRLLALIQNAAAMKAEVTAVVDPTSAAGSSSSSSGGSSSSGSSSSGSSGARAHIVPIATGGEADVNALNKQLERR
jgi:uncharacterized membrane protein YgcG